MNAPAPPRRGPVGPALALGVLALVVVVLLVVAVLAPVLGPGAGVLLPLRLLGLLAGAAAVAFGVLVLRAARRGPGGRSAGAAAVTMGAVAVLSVLVVVPALVRSQVQSFQARQEARASAGPERSAEEDVRIDRCVPSPGGYTAYLSITNSTDVPARYDVTVEVVDGSGTSRGYLLGVDQTVVEPGRTVQEVAEGSVSLGTDGTCRVLDASRGAGPA